MIIKGINLVKIKILGITMITETRDGTQERKEHLTREMGIKIIKIDIRTKIGKERIQISKISIDKMIINTTKGKKITYIYNILNFRPRFDHGNSYRDD